MTTNGRIGLIGSPVEQSLSPAFQQPAFDALGLHIRYELWHTSLAELPARLDAIRSGHALGANVTVPHKAAAFALMDSVTDLASRAGAVNTISAQDGQLTGDNTDIHGFIVPLNERGFDFQASSAVILGAGGAARGVAVALLDAGIAGLTIVNRTRQRADDIVAALADRRVTADGLEALSERVSGARLLVNAAATGWTQATLSIGPETLARLAPCATAYDLTYRDTPFLSSARQAGLSTIDGLPMLVHQGAKSFEIWTGHPAPVDLMWRSAVAAREKRGG